MVPGGMVCCFAPLGRCFRQLNWQHSSILSLSSTACLLTHLPNPPFFSAILAGRPRHHFGGGAQHQRLHPLCWRGRDDDLVTAEERHTFCPGAVNRDLQRPGHGRLHPAALPLKQARRRPHKQRRLLLCNLCNRAPRHDAWALLGSFFATGPSFRGRIVCPRSVNHLPTCHQPFTPVASVCRTTCALTSRHKALSAWPFFLHALNTCPSPHVSSASLPNPSFAFTLPIPGCAKPALLTLPPLA